MRLRDQRPFEIGKFRLVLGGAHIGPDQPAALDARIGLGLHARLQIVVARLARQVDAVAVDVELPAVIDAAEAALFIAAEEQRRGAVRAVLVEQADAALAVAEHDEPLAHQLHAHRRIVGLGDVVRKARRDPVAAHQLAHRRAGPDAGEAVVVFA